MFRKTFFLFSIDIIIINVEPMIIMLIILLFGLSTNLLYCLYLLFICLFIYYCRKSNSPFALALRVEGMSQREYRELVCNPYRPKFGPMSSDIL